MTASTKIIAVLLLVAGVWFGYGAWAKHQRGIGAKPYIAAIEQQKIEADKLLAVETEKSRAAGQALADFKRNQEKEDEKNKSTVDGLTVQLRAAAGPTLRLRDPARCGGSSGPAKGAGPAGPGSGPEDRADAEGLLSADLTGLLLEQAKIADSINIAYASCRADAFNLRGVLK